MIYFNCFRLDSFSLSSLFVLSSRYLLLASSISFFNNLISSFCFNNKLSKDLSLFGFFDSLFTFKTPLFLLLLTFLLLLLSILLVLGAVILFKLFKDLLLSSFFGIVFILFVFNLFLSINLIDFSFCLLNNLYKGRELFLIGFEL